MAVQASGALTERLPGGKERSFLSSCRNQGAMSSQGALEMPGLVGGIVGRGSEPSARL